MSSRPLSQLSARLCLLAVDRITRGGRIGRRVPLWIDRDTRKGDELNRLLRGRYYDVVKSIKRRIKAAIKPPREWSEGAS